MSRAHTIVRGADAIGPDTDFSHGTHVLEPLLIIWALWSTGAWRPWRTARDRPADSCPERVEAHVHGQ